MCEAEADSPSSPADSGSNQDQDAACDPSSCLRLQKTPGQLRSPPSAEMVSLVHKAGSESSDHNSVTLAQRTGNYEVCSLGRKYCEELGQAKPLPLKEIQVTSAGQHSSYGQRSPGKGLDVQGEKQSIHCNHFSSNQVKRVLPSQTSSESFASVPVSLFSAVASDRHSFRTALNTFLRRNTQDSQLSSLSATSEKQIPGNDINSVREKRAESSLSSNSFCASVKSSISPDRRAREESINSDSSQPLEKTGAENHSPDIFDAGHECEAETKESKCFHENDGREPDSLRGEMNSPDFSSDRFTLDRADCDKEKIVFIGNKRNRRENIKFRQADRSEVLDSDSDTLDIDSQITFTDEVDFPLSQDNASAFSTTNGNTLLTSTELSLGTGSQTLSFTEDSLSLQFTEDGNLGGSETEDSKALSTFTQDLICEDSRDRLQDLKAQHMAQMGTLTFTQTQTFPM